MKNSIIEKAVKNTQNSTGFANDMIDTNTSKQSAQDALRKQIEKNKKFLKAHSEWVRTRKRI